MSNLPLTRFPSKPSLFSTSSFLIPSVILPFFFPFPSYYLIFHFSLPFPLPFPFFSPLASLPFLYILRTLKYERQKKVNNELASLSLLTKVERRINSMIFFIKEYSLESYTVMDNHRNVVLIKRLPSKICIPFLQY